MKKNVYWMALACTLVCLGLSSCKNKTRNVWDDGQTSSSFKGKGSPWASEETLLTDEDLVGPAEDAFIALSDDDLRPQLGDAAIPQPNMSPGDPGSGLPGIEGFKKPSSELAAIFRNILFKTDEHHIKSKEQLAILERVASYLKENPSTYIFCEGHCDERGPEAYNFSLGSRRADFVRTFLIQKGVHLNQIYTISYGKERPVDMGHAQESWEKNRRVQFKIFEK